LLGKVKEGAKNLWNNAKNIFGGNKKNSTKKHRHNKKHHRMSNDNSTAS